MRIRPDSTVGQRLLRWGVAERELAAGRVFRWDLQLGAAVTLPIGAGRVLILVRGRYMARDQAGEFTDRRLFTTLRHEF